jgi:hypothetical protein
VRVTECDGYVKKRNEYDGQQHEKLIGWRKRREDVARKLYCIRIEY